MPSIANHIESLLLDAFSKITFVAAKSRQVLLNTLKRTKQKLPQASGVSGLVVKSTKMTTIQNHRFNNIQDNSQCINLDNWETKQNVIIEDSTFSNILNARCIMATTETSTFQKIVRNCHFMDNSIRKSTRGEYISGCGASILCQHQGNLVVTKCNFTNNMAEANGGAVYAETKAIELNMLRFELCSAAPYEEDGHPL